MQYFKVSAFLLGVSLSAISLNSLANASTILNITKTTTITGSDAERFKKLFGEELSASNPALNIQCNKKSCVIVSTHSGFSGELAKHLLNGRKEVLFLSDNKKFKLQCGEANVSYCNVSQEDAILK